MRILHCAIHGQDRVPDQCVACELGNHKACHGRFIQYEITSVAPPRGADVSFECLCGCR